MSCGRSEPLGGTSVPRRYICYERFDKVHNKIQRRWNDDVDGDWSRQRAIMSFLRQFLGKSRKPAADGTKCRRWRGNIFSSSRKANDVRALSRKKKKKKKNEKEECELLFRLGRSNRSLENRKVH